MIKKALVLVMCICLVTTILACSQDTLVQDPLVGMYVVEEGDTIGSFVLLNADGTCEISYYIADTGSGFGFTGTWEKSGDRVEILLRFPSQPGWPEYFEIEGRNLRDQWGSLLVKQ